MTVKSAVLVDASAAPPSHPSAAPPSHLGAAPFARCEQMFSCYPLATVPHFDGCGSRSMILMTRAAGEPKFFVLTETGRAFHIRPWNSAEEAAHEVTPGEQIPAALAQAIAHGMPVPRCRAVLGWAPDRQVTAILTLHGGHTAGTGTVPAVPAIQVIPMSGTATIDWPPSGADLLGDGQLWDYLERGDIVDIAPLLARCPGQAFRAPCPHGHGSPRGAACVVVTASLEDSEYWLPAGVYTDHWILREDIPLPPAGQLLALPGTVDMAHELGTGRLSAVSRAGAASRRRSAQRTRRSPACPGRWPSPPERAPPAAPPAACQGHRGGAWRRAPWRTPGRGGRAG